MPEETSRPRAKVRLTPLVALIFFSVSGGAYGLEPLVSSSGPGMAFILLLVTPVIYAIPVALFTAELSAAIPVDGGTYAWVRQGLGEFWGHQEGMLWWITSWVDMALYPVMFADYLAGLIPGVAGGATPLLHVAGLDFDLHWLVGVGCVVIPFTLLNLRGAKAVGDNSTLLTVVALAPFALLAAWGIPKLVSHGIDPVAPLTPHHTGAVGAFGAGLWIVMWNYAGFDSIAQVTEEVEDPQRNVPRALFYAIALIVAAYVIPLLGALAAGGWQTWADGSFVDVGKQLGGPWLGHAITIGGLASAAGLFSSLLLTNSRIPFVLAEDGYLPRRLVRRSRRFGTPVAAIVLCSAIYAVFATSKFQTLVVVDVFLTNITLLLELGALIALRRRRPDLERPFRIPGGALGLTIMSVPLVGVIVFAAVEQFHDDGWKAVWWTAGTLGLSLLSWPIARGWAARACRGSGSPPGPAGA